MKTFIQFILFAYIFLKFASLINGIEHLIPNPPTYIPPPSSKAILNNLQSEYEYARKNWVVHTLKRKFLSNVTLDALKSKQHKRDFNVSLDIFTNPNVWVALVNIGTPGQGVALLYDLENKTSFVESTLCFSCFSFGFDPTNSSTYQTQNKTSYKVGRYHIYEDASDIINVNDFNLNQAYTFGMVDNLDFSLSLDLITAGVFGLGYEKDCNAGKCTTFNSFLKSKGLIPNNMFSLLMVPQYIKNLCASGFYSCLEYIVNGGLATFGGYLPSLTTSNIVWLPLIDQGGLWKININGAAAGFLLGGGHFAIDQSFPALLSNSNDQMVFGVDFANQLTALVGGSFDPNYGYIGPCLSGGIYVAIKLGQDGSDFYANVLDYIYAIPIQNGSTTCHGGFTDTTIANLPYWVLGLSFITGNYVIFDVDNSQVGVAQTHWAISKPPQ